VNEVQLLTVEAGDDGIRLDRWFKRRWPHINHIAIQKLTRSGQIRVDGARAKPDTRMAGGAQVRVPPLPDAPPPMDPHILTQDDIAFARSMVLFEDDDILVLNKPSGLAVQGGTKTINHVDRLLSAWGQGMARPRLVHRLDRDTSGVLLLGKSAAVAAKLGAAFAGREVQKIYWAVVAGVPRPTEGVISIPLIKKGVGDREMVVPAEPKEAGAEAARSEYVTLGRDGGRAAWMGLHPYTGRTHQLRAHMLAIGNPILGDPKYNTPASKALSAGLKLQLHARRLELDHPARGRIVVEAPLSPQMKAAFAQFGFDPYTAPKDPFVRGLRRTKPS
jgi:23S rRNA pseudouridine955/2504/2580 synthase